MPALSVQKYGIILLKCLLIFVDTVFLKQIFEWMLMANDDWMNYWNVSFSLIHVGLFSNLI